MTLPDLSTDGFSPGAVIAGRYRLVEPIGEGGMGTVWRAEHVLMGKLVALKMLRAELGTIDDVVRRFEREAQAASRLSHEGIVAVTDFGRAESGALFLVMELVRGEPLSALMARQGRVPPARAVEIARAVLRALAHAHAHGVVHRDLKPDNVMLVARGEGEAPTPKLLDFGIAKITHGPAGEPLTRTGIVFGTPHYLSPEQAAGQDVDARADLYSLGVVLYEMLTGRKPFEADDVVKLVAMHVTAVPPSFAARAPEANLPPALETVVRQALAKSPGERPPSAAAFIAALDAAEAARPAPSATLARAWRRARDAARRLAALPPRRRAALAGLAVVPLVAVVLLVRAGGPPAPAAPPAVRPPSAELAAPLGRIEAALSAGRLADARAALALELSAHPEAARVHLLLGHLEAAEKHDAAALAAYREAVRLDRGYAADAALLRWTRALLADKKLALDAVAFLGTLGEPGCAPLAETASKDARRDVRSAARAAADEARCPGVDRVASLALDLAQARTCAEKREAARALGATGDKRAADPLRRARRAGGSLESQIGSLFGGGGDCARKEIDAALAALGEPVTTPKPASETGTRR